VSEREPTVFPRLVRVGPCLEGEKFVNFMCKKIRVIQIPFDILFNLGVDIFSDLSFDTWVIQTVLRKLLGVAPAWDHPGN
jgi:hypothetical protein